MKQSNISFETLFVSSYVIKLCFTSVSSSPTYIRKTVNECLRQLRVAVFVAMLVEVTVNPAPPLLQKQCFRFTNTARKECSHEREVSSMRSIERMERRQRRPREPRRDRRRFAWRGHSRRRPFILPNSAVLRVLLQTSRKSFTSTANTTYPSSTFKEHGHAHGQSRSTIDRVRHPSSNRIPQHLPHLSASAPVTCGLRDISKDIQ